MNNFERSSVVYLKSGSPPLTVLGTDDNGDVHVRWRVTGNLEYRKYPAACLTEEIRLVGEAQ